jgi:tetratricopeptide (TPR) repeat protein
MRHQHQEIVASFRAVLLAAAALAAVVPLRPSQAAGDGATATQGIAIAGSVSNSTINNTVYQENPAMLAMLAKALSDKDVSEEHRREAEAKAAELATKFGFTKAAVTEFFKILGETDVPEEKIPARLVEIASHFAQTRDELAALAPDDPHAAELARSAKSALDTGRLAEADSLLDEAKEVELVAFRQARELKQKAQEAEDRHALNAAKLTAGRGSIALTQLRYTDAADRFKEAADLVPAGHPDEQAKYLGSQAHALYRQGDEKGDNAALKQSVEIWHLVLAQRPRDRVPPDWAETQNDLGLALFRLGERENGIAHLTEAVSTFDAALEERLRARVPLDWAQTQVNLGNALTTLGERESGTTRLEQAVAAYNEALKEYTRARVPLDWAATQNNLGAVLERLGERESGTAHLEAAVAAYRAALEERTRARVPLDWAQTQVNLGNALTTLGERESGTTRLEQAVAAYNKALKEYTRDRVPLDWAATQVNLGNVLTMLGERESGTTRLEQAVAAYNEALKEYTRLGCRSSGRRRRPTSASLSRRLASGRAGRRVWSRRSPPITRRSRNTRALGCRSSGR